MYPKRFASLVLLAIAISHSSFALDAKDIARAEKIIRIMVELNQKFPHAQGQLTAPLPLTDKSGKYFIPYTQDGTLTPWADKAISAQVGAAVGEKVGEKAGGAVLSRAVPMGGLLSGVAKKKGKELGAVAALGGFEAIKTGSDYSFNNLDDYAVFLHVKHGGSANFAQALATAMSIYPDLEKRYDQAVRNAYAQAESAARAAEAAQQAAAKSAAL